MGNYNPRVPFILGEEWVPIRDEDTAFSPAVSALEVGHRLTLAQSRTLQDGRFYARDLPVYTGQAFGIDIYPAGLEDQTGPISSVVIPVCAGTITGAGITLSNASTVAEAVFSPSDGKSVAFFSSGVFSQVSFFFGANSYAAPLSGKRILTVNVLYIANGTINAGPDDTLIDVLAYLQRDNLASGKASFYKAFAGTGFTSTQSPGDFIGTLKRARLGDIAYFWGTNTAASTSERAFYTYPVLQQFEAAASNRVHLQMELQALPLTSASGTLSYLALEVVYCEEQRSASGARQFGVSPVPTNLSLTNYTEQTNIIPLRSPQSLAINPILAAGGYTAALVSPNLGDAVLDDFVPINIANSRYPSLNALRELYQIPSHPGVQVDIPFPLEDHLGETFTQVETHILPQLSLHASGGTLTEPHVYGRQGQAQVYGVNTATQELYDNVSGFSAVYPQVRYYARRFGDTTVPLTLTGVGGLSGSTVSITPADFDELAEILDGWREVTLRFATPPTMGAVAGEPGWTWSAPSETAGNRWEILAACAPAISGIPCNLYNLVPTPNQLYEATYEPPGGSLAELTWMPQGVASPWVTGATADDGCDAVLIFSQDPPTVTGVSISQESQAVTGLGLDCGSLPCCIPSGIGYQRITWSANGAVCDTFERVETAQWGNADTGQPWVLSGGIAADYNVADGVGTMALTDTNTRTATQAGPIIDVDVSFTFTTPQLATVDDYNADVVARRVDGSNFYRAQAKMDITGNIDLMLQSVIAGVATNLDTELNAVPYAAGDAFGIRLQVVNTTLRAKIWNAAGAEPLAWMVEATDATFTTGGFGIRAIRDPANTNAGLVIAFDNFVAVPVSLIGGAYELQRWDYLDPTGDFQTIMRATDICTNSFNDYEARVGVTSVYRVRSLNALNFAGVWSTYVSGTPAAPGVTTGACDDMNGVLIFTSNADQSGHSNAAYVMQWERDPTEEFALPEAGMVEYQPMYGRDGSVAFHGTERGFETFSRTVLLQAGAISPVALADASTIRDLAWADLPYVCVRDELGDRWLSSVRVPSVAVRHNRTKYMARIEIVEVTATPYAVDP